jgi:hypothetical protein
MDDLTSLIRDRLDRCEDRAARLEAIANLQHTLDFERRLAELTDDQHRAMVEAGEPHLSDRQRAALDAAKSEGERERLFEAIARANYMQQCAWVDYLNGASKTVPYCEPSPHQPLEARAQ